MIDFPLKFCGTFLLTFKPKCTLLEALKCALRLYLAPALRFNI
jgi:hypothetical protein